MALPLLAEPYDGKAIEAQAAAAQQESIIAPPLPLNSLVALADTIASQPERFALATGDQKITQDSLQALKDVFADAIASEGDSLAHIGQFLREALEEVPSTTTRSASAKKRKRTAQRFAPHHSLFPPTPLSGLVVDGMHYTQIWEQLEFRGRAIENVLSKILVSTAEGEQQVPEDEVELKTGTEHDDGNVGNIEVGDEENEEEMIRHLSSLSDAELRALGIDPALRDELIVEDGDFEPDPNEQDIAIEDEYADGYPGASDISSDEEAEGYQPGSSKRVYFEPLKTEKEQRRKKEEEEMRNLQWSQPYMQEADEMDYDDNSDSSDESVEEDDDTEEEEATQTAPKRRRSLLDSLDEEGSSSGQSRRKGPRHPTLDDSFFSIDDFNRQTEEAERREIFKEAGAGEDSDDEDIDLFQSVEAEQNGMDVDGEDEEKEEEEIDAHDPTQIRFADFFLPPASAPKAGGRGSADRRAKGKGKGSRVGEGAKLAKQERDRRMAEAGGEGVDTEQGGTSQSEDELPSDVDDDSSEEESEGPARPTTKVKFAPTVAIRNIKSRRNRPDALDLSQLQRLQAMSAGLADGSEEEEEEQQLEGEDEESEDEEEEESDGEEEGDSDDAEDLGGEEGEELESAFDEDEEDETARRFAGDLFDDDDEEEDSEEALSSSKLSAHEKRLANLQKEIARLESENVGAKNWTLSGEASSRARPKDSLLEEDLDFEQSSKPTPTITVESTESLEALIKRRILEGQFDDVIPRRAIVQAEFKADYELSDRKSGKSLAEEYENDFQLANGGRDAPEFKGESQLRLEKDRAEVEELMEDIFNRLDALSNAHFIPKAPKMKITTLSNTPTLNVQEGLPTSSVETSQLAPQEVFNLTEGDNSGALIGDKSELTPQEKQALFKRKKKELKRQREERESLKEEKRLNDLASGKIQPSSGGETRKEKQDALKSLIGNKGVSVVGKGDPKGKGKGKARDKGDEGEKKGEKFKL